VISLTHVSGDFDNSLSKEITDFKGKMHTEVRSRAEQLLYFNCLLHLVLVPNVEVTIKIFNNHYLTYLDNF